MSGRSTDDESISSGMTRALEAARLGAFVVDTGTNDGDKPVISYCNRWLRELLLGGEGGDLDSGAQAALVALYQGWRDEWTSLEMFHGELVAAGGRVAVQVDFVADDERPERVFAFVTDYSKQVEAARAIAAMETRFRSLVNAADDAVVVSRAGVVLYANPATAQLVGVPSSDALVGRSLAEFMSADEVPIMRSRMAEVAEGSKLAPREYSGRRADGANFSLEISSVSIPWEGGRAVLAFGRDVSERRRLQDELIQADRMASVGLLAAGIAHEINNPLTYTLLHLAKLQRMLPDLVAAGDTRQEVERLLSQAAEGGDRVGAIVRDLLTFVRADENRGEHPVDLRDVVVSATKLARMAIDPEAKVEHDHASIPAVRADAARLGQVFVNLVVNALQAMVESSVRELTTVAKVDGEYVRIDICDRGPGIEPGIAGHMFDAFFTTKDIGVGTGLGLPISRSIVQSFGGSIEAAPRDGGGSVFSVRLPVCRDLHEVAETPAVSHSRRVRVLLVDDDTRVLEAISELLSERYDVTCADAGHAALSMFDDGGVFDAVLCDLAMPDVDGVRIYSQLSGTRPIVAKRLLFMTGGARTTRQREFADGHAERFLSKPLQADEVFAMIDALVEELGTA